MKKQKYTFTIRVIALLLVLSSLLSGTAFAAMPETMDPLASNYIKGKTSYLSPVGSGRVQIHFDVKATGMMDKLGVKTIEMYESTNQTTWTKVKTYQSDTYAAMLDEDVSTHTGYVTFLGVAGRYYKAYVRFYAQNSSGNDSVYVWTTPVRAT